MKRFTPIFGLLLICWIVFVINNLVLQGSLTRFGIHPREISGLPGIIWSPFLHGSFRHLAANSLPLLILGAVICGRSRGEFAAVTIAGILLGGGLTWLFARTANHVGASGLIFCYFGFLTLRAYFDRTILTLCLSVICLVGYGGMLRGVLPTSPDVSWESHFAGLIAGAAVAWVVSKTKKEENKSLPDAPVMQLPPGIEKRKIP